jgi:hypothetical protein
MTRYHVQFYVDGATYHLDEIRRLHLVENCSRRESIGEPYRQIINGHGCWGLLTRTRLSAESLAGFLADPSHESAKALDIAYAVSYDTGIEYQYEDIDLSIVSYMQHDARLCVW